MRGMTGRDKVDLRLHEATVRYGVQGDGLLKVVLNPGIGLAIIHAHAVQGSPEVPLPGSCSPRRLVELDGYNHLNINHPAIATVALQKREIVNDVNGGEGQSVGVQVSVHLGQDTIEGCFDREGGVSARVVGVKGVEESLVERHYLPRIHSSRITRELEVPVKVFDLQVTVPKAEPLEGRSAVAKTSHVAGSQSVHFTVTSTRVGKEGACDFRKRSAEGGYKGIRDR